MGKYIDIESFLQNISKAESNNRKITVYYHKKGGAYNENSLSEIIDVLTYEKARIDCIKNISAKDIT